MAQETLFNDPANFRAMLVPHESVDAANEAIGAFFEGVQELRKKHRLPNVLIVADVFYLLPNGNEAQGRLSSMLGDEVHAEELAAYVHGYETARRQERHAAMGMKTLRAHRDSAAVDGETKPRKR